ncbi:MAG: thiamine phosphate synthase [Acidimicrobiales bacterium]
MATTPEEPEGNRLARLHVVTVAGTDEQVVDRVEAVLAAGAPLVQLRCKFGTDRARWLLAAEVVRRCQRVGASCVVNDRTDIAAAAGADGVHLGADDLPVAAARRILGAGALVGATRRDPDAGRQAEGQGASYLGVGPVYATTTKAGLPEPIGLRGVARVVAAVGLPVIAVGGVTTDRVGALLDAGAHGVAVSATVFAGSGVRATTAELAAAIDAWATGPR